MMTVMMVCGSGHHWGALIANWDTFDARVTIQDKEVLCPRCGEIFVQCRDFYTGKKWSDQAGPSSMNHVFCHHPSMINGRGQRCPDCNAKPESNRSSHPIEDSTLGVWADSVMNKWGDTSAVRITED
jgi:DNA-directed RNA polymerase subunit RPC12/RpoP